MHMTPLLSGSHAGMHVTPSHPPPAEATTTTPSESSSQAQRLNSKHYKILQNP